VPLPYPERLADVRGAYTDDDGERWLVVGARLMRDPRLRLMREALRRRPRVRELAAVE
jgi:hypothetical protein